MSELDKKYVGTFMGFNYNMDFDTDEDFLAWLFAKIKRLVAPEMWEKIISKFLQQSDEYQTAKAKIVEFESRITALENP